MSGMVGKLLRRLPTTTRKISFPQITKKGKSIKSAVDDTFYSTKDTYERHKVVCTIGASIASVAAAWAGYTLRHLLEIKVERRLDLIENTMRSNYHRAVLLQLMLPQLEPVWIGLARRNMVCKQEDQKGADEIVGTKKTSKVAAQVPKETMDETQIT